MVKVVHLVPDNATRWLSQYYMIHRALATKTFIEDLCDEQIKAVRRSNQSDKQLPPCLQPDARLTDDDWALLKEMNDLLANFHIVLRVLEGDGMARERSDGSTRSYGLIWNVCPAFEYMLESLENASKRSIPAPNAARWRSSVKTAWHVLDKYYEKLDECPIYYAATALHPNMRWKYFEVKWAERPDWILSAQQRVKSLWELEYKDRPIGVNSTIAHTGALKSQYVSPFDRYSKLTRNRYSNADVNNGPNDEYERWLLEDITKNNTVEDEDPFRYWYGRRSEYPRLSQMAVEVLSVLPMSAECERLFSSSGRMVSPLRTRLESSTIAMAQALRSWLKAGVIGDSVMEAVELVLSTKNHREDEEDDDGGGPVDCEDDPEAAIEVAD